MTVAIAERNSRIDEYIIIMIVTSDRIGGKTAKMIIDNTKVQKGAWLVKHYQRDVHEAIYISILPTNTLSQLGACTVVELLVLPTSRP